MNSEDEKTGNQSSIRAGTVFPTAYSVPAVVPGRWQALLMCVK